MKVYLGANIYVDNNGYGIVLTVEPDDSHGPTSILCLDTNAIKKLLKHIEKTVILENEQKQKQEQESDAPLKINSNTFPYGENCEGLMDTFVCRNPGCSWCTSVYGNVNKYNWEWKG